MSKLTLRLPWKRRELQPGESFAIIGLSPSAHGTLLALRDLGEVRLVEEAVAAELVEHGYAERVRNGLRVTDAGRSFRPVRTK